MAADEINPFYSERVQREMMLEAARPDGLPSPMGSEGVLPVTDGSATAHAGGIGKGRGGIESAGEAKVFVTPETKKDRGTSDYEKGGYVKSQGALPSPTDDPAVLKTMGPLQPDESDCKKATGATAGVGKVDEEPSTDSLQRALERQMVEELRDQNKRLMDELARLKEQNRTRGSADSNTCTSTSWSEVGDLRGQPGDKFQPNSKPAEMSGQPVQQRVNGCCSLPDLLRIHVMILR